MVLAQSRKQLTLIGVGHASQGQPFWEEAIEGRDEAMQYLPWGEMMK